MESSKTKEIEKNIVKEVCVWLKENQATKSEISNKVLEKIKSNNYLAEDWQIQYAKDRIMEEIKMDNPETNTLLTKKKTYLGLVSIIFSFIPGWIIVSIVLAIIALRKKDHDHTLPIIGLIISGIVIIGFMIIAIK